MAARWIGLSRCDSTDTAEGRRKEASLDTFSLRAFSDKRLLVSALSGGDFSSIYRPPCVSWSRLRLQRESEFGKQG